jgi:sialic acid synthase SpsE
MIDEIKAIDKGKHEVIFKHQLFTEAGKNIPLNPNVFDDAIWYAKEKGYQTTSSVFDKENLHLLLQYEIPFVKIANRRDLDYLIGEVPRKIPVYVSKGEMPYMSDWRQRDIVTMACVSHYPATLAEYEEAFYPFQLRHAVSDHTVGLGLWHKYHPDIIEMHYRLEDSTGLDAGPFAKTPAELRGVIG